MIHSGQKHFQIGLTITLFVLFHFTSCTLQKNIVDKSKYRTVDSYGQLAVDGKFIVGQYGDTVTLEGMSLFWSQWIHKYYNYETLKWLRDDWHCEVIRAAMAVKPNGYLDHPGREMRKVVKVIEACLDLGLYVIVDWHSHTAESETEQAVAFFSEIARRYGDKPNIIYEIYNEPLVVSWDEVVKPYHEKVIAAIRAYDPDNIIIVGSPFWSQDVDKAALNPIKGKNIAYSLHFYAATHKQWLRDKAQIAIDKGLAIWVTEFGTCESDGNGPIDSQELQIWYDFMKDNKISWCNWSVADKEETSSVLLPGTTAKGHWKESELSESGKMIREKLREINP